MLRIRSLFYSQLRGVRSNSFTKNRPPYPFFFKSLGWRECGPYYEQIWEWPDKDSGWSMVPMHFPDKPEPSFVDDDKSQKTGYPDPSTNRFVSAPDAMPELIVPPDLDDCKLKPYVSFRTPETEVAAPALTSKDLFEIFYAGQIIHAFKEGKYANADSLLEREGDQAKRKKALTEKGIPVLDDGREVTV